MMGNWAMTHPILTFIIVIIALLTVDSIGCEIGKGMARVKKVDKDG